VISSDSLLVTQRESIDVLLEFTNMSVELVYEQVFATTGILAYLSPA
jgi:hypothetical protein